MPIDSVSGKVFKEMGDLQQSCVNHPERPAMYKCKMCNTPICQLCAISTTYGHFCSEECHQKRLRIIEKQHVLDAKPSPVGFQFPSWLVKLFIFCLLTVVILGLVGWFVLGIRTKDQAVIAIKNPGTTIKRTISRFRAKVPTPSTRQPRQRTR